MLLSVGDRLGPYEILALIGKGGMGEVYRAHDPRLNRDVAIKISASQFSERFAREAQAIAALNHPNICTLYDVGPNYLVMEFVEGESPQGPMALHEALAIARQITDALEAAHDKNIVHRDLKPANIKVRPDGTVKVLDFGLAKVSRTSKSSDGNAENSPTLTIGMTEAGMILGTAAYMAPEQARGKDDLDRRSDIWAFGVVFYELLTGKQLFRGEDVGETLAAVIKDQPTFDDTPQQVRRLLQRCLEKDPRKRLRAAGDAWELMGEAASGSSRSPLSWKIAAVALGAGLLGVSWVAWRTSRPAERPSMRLSVDLGPDAIAGVNSSVSISRDGTRIAFSVRGGDGKSQLATRTLDQPAAYILPGTSNGGGPFFSPDGQWIGFFSDNKLKKISVRGGEPVTLADVSSDFGGSWGEDGNIVISSSFGRGLSQIPETGGVAHQLTRMEEKGELAHRWPQVLPGGLTALFTASVATAEWENASIVAVSLKTGQRKTLLSGGYFGRYIPGSAANGHLVYIHEGTLFSVPFDAARLELLGTSTPLLEDVAGDPGTGAGQFDFSQTGTFLYRQGKAADQTYPVVWMDSSGATKPLLSAPGVYTTPRFSPDGKRLGLSLNSAKGRDLYVYDWQRDTMTRLTFTSQGHYYPTWMPDGKHLAFRSSSSAGYWIGWVRADGAGEPQRLVEAKGVVVPYSFSPDGRYLAYAELRPEAGYDLWMLPLDLKDPDHPKPGKPELFLRTPFDEYHPAFSPDGRWVAYQSNESGRHEVYVRPFPASSGAGRWQISTAGGGDPVWSRDGKQLFFATIPAGHIMVADYTAAGDSFVPGKPRLWSNQRIRPVAPFSMDPAPDGKRFAVFPVQEVKEDIGSLHVTFLLNYFDQFRRSVSTGK